jgi:hypothetical protein
MDVEKYSNQHNIAARRERPHLVLSLPSRTKQSVTTSSAEIGTPGHASRLDTPSSGTHTGIGIDASPSLVGSRASQLDELGHRSLGKNLDKVAAWVEETRRVQTASWASRVAKSYGLTDHDAFTRSKSSRPGKCMIRM